MNSATTTESKQTLRVLVVDDEPKNRELICDTLKVNDYHVDEAESGAEALEVIAARPPDVVLLDVAMPGMDGLEVCRRLKADKKTASVPVIMVTAHVHREDRIAGIQAGANDYITKPVDLKDLVLRVRNAGLLKRQHDELEANYQRLQELEGLRDSLTSMIVHDLRSPLTGILMGIDLLISVAEERLQPEELACLSECKASAQKISRMISSLLDLNRLEAGEMPLDMTEIPIIPLVKETIHSLDGVAKKVKIEFPIPDEEIVTKCDSKIVERILSNLLENAIKFTPDGSPVRVALSRDKDHARLSVRDYGAGIPSEYHHKIFEKFAQVKNRNARVGTGLGLTFCKLAIEAHGGNIGVESEVGQGSVFWITLPTA